MLADEEARSLDGDSRPTPLDFSVMARGSGVPGMLVGVLAPEIQTPSTSMPLSNARTPKGTPFACRRFVLKALCISVRWAALRAAILVYLRIL